jgi:predicted DNA-binding transcriptional regulator AlpA
MRSPSASAQITARPSRPKPEWPPRCLSLPQAAYYTGVCANTFSKWVSEGRMPKPAAFGRRKLWDRVQIDDALDAAFNGRTSTQTFANVHEFAV